MAHNHMRRSAISGGRPGGLIRGITWKGNMRVAHRTKALGVFLYFSQSIHAAKPTIRAIAVNMVFQFSDITNKSRKRWNMIDIAICDGEPNIRDYLSYLIKKRYLACEENKEPEPQGSHPFQRGRI